MQVAIKISAFDIAKYLIEQGADVNFIEEERGDTSLRCPVLHDAIGAVMFCLSCSPLCTKEEIVERIDNAGKALYIIRLLCEKGADVNKLASNGMNALNICVHKAENVLDRQEAYPATQKEAEIFLVAMLDILIENGADFIDWANSSHYPSDTSADMINKALFIDNFIPKEDKVIEYTFRGKVNKTIQKGDIDKTAHTRSVIQKYVKDKNIII